MRGSRRLGHRRASSLVAVAAVVRGADARQPIEQRGELPELVVVVMRAEELADLSRVRLRGLAELVAAGASEDRVADAAIGRALLAGDEPVALEAVEEPRGAARGQREAVRNVDAPHSRLGSPCEQQKRFVLVEAQAVIGAQLSAQPASHGDAAANEADERLDRR